MIGLMTALFASAAWRALRDAVWISPGFVQVPGPGFRSPRRYPLPNGAGVARGTSRGYPIAILSLHSGKRVQLAPTMTWGTRRAKAELDALIDDMNRTIQAGDSRPNAEIAPVRTFQPKAVRSRLVGRVLIGVIVGVWAAVLAIIVLLPGIVTAVFAVALGVANTISSLLLLRRPAKRPARITRLHWVGRRTLRPGTVAERVRGESPSDHARKRQRGLPQ